MGNKSSTRRAKNERETRNQNRSGPQTSADRSSNTPRSSEMFETGARCRDVAWRTFEDNGGWTVEYKRRLLNDISKVPIPESTGHINILLVGAVKSGKSSLINSVACIDKERISQVTVAGGVGASMTKRLKVFTPKHINKRIHIFDTMGVQEAQGLNIKDVLYLVNGNVKPKYKFNPAGPISEDNPDFDHEPPENNKMHCVAFVIDANEVGHKNITDDLRKKIRQLLDELDSHDIPRIVILTKLDLMCEAVKEDITKSYQTAIMSEAVHSVKSLFNTQEQNVFPVQNYENEMGLDVKKDILILLALRQMINFATDFLEAH